MNVEAHNRLRSPAHMPYPPHGVGICGYHPDNEASRSADRNPDTEDLGTKWGRKTTRGPGRTAFSCACGPTDDDSAFRATFRAFNPTLYTSQPANFSPTQAAPHTQAYS